MLLTASRSERLPPVLLGVETTQPPASLGGPEAFRSMSEPLATTPWEDPLSTKTPRPLRPLTAFLSHSYRSPAVNLHFFNVFSKVARVQFSVDIGELDTNVTRLERLVRAADAFIGVYPLPAGPDEVPTAEEMRKHSRYFRLELDLAIRAQIPTIVFKDSRYGHLLSCPSWIRQYPFDAQEVSRTGQSPRDRLYAKAFKSFCDAALAFQSYRINDAVGQRDRNKVGLLLSQAEYQTNERARIREAMENSGREVVEVTWPPVLSKEFYAAISDVDWVVVDVGDDSASAGIVGFLHGFFIPAIRLVKVRSAYDQKGEVSHSLFGGQEVGFPKDIVTWTNADELGSAVLARVSAILSPQRLVDTLEAAVSYFESAALRKEVVFVSYSRKDIGKAKEIVAALKKVFKTVFDYKDGESIVPGKPWLEEIFKTLSRAAVAVPLLSKDYFESGNCLHEAQEIVALRDAGKLRFLPLKLYDEEFEMPPWIRATQYARLTDMKSPSEVASMIVKSLSEHASK